MKRVWIVIALMAFNGQAHEIFTDHAWQSSSSGVIISLRNKLLNDPYVVTIKVINLKTGLSVSKDIESGHNDWNQETFPDDFRKCEGIYEVYKDGPNQFMWEAHIEDRLIMSGKFTYPHDEVIWTEHD